MKLFQEQQGNKTHNQIKHGHAHMHRHAPARTGTHAHKRPLMDNLREEKKLHIYVWPGNRASIVVLTGVGRLGALQSA